MRFYHIATLALLGAGSLFAEPPTEGGRQREGGKPTRRPADGDKRGEKGGERAGFAEFLRAGDKDGDGAVSRSEFAELKRLIELPEAKRNEIFKRLDKNGDGFIRKDELRSPPRPEGGRRPMPRLEELDKSGDGKVSFEEFLESEFVKRLPEDRRRGFFDRLDRNGDDVISAEDKPERRRSDGAPDGKGRRPGGRGDRGFIESHDKNGDGTVDFEEFRKSPWIASLGEDEQEDRFEKMDKNGDQKIDKEDLPMPPREGGRSPAKRNGEAKGEKAGGGAP